MLEMFKDTRIFEKTHRRVMTVLWVVVALGLFVAAAGLWHNYAWVHRPQNRYEKELPLCGIVAVGKTASVPKEEIREMVSTADALWDSPPLLEQTRWYKDMMRGPRSKVTLTPEDVLILGM